MRAYFFNNMYLSSIQQGIQAAHAVTELAVKYQRCGDGFTPAGTMFYNWAENHKTMILLNGGYASNLQDLYDFIHAGLVNEKSYPYAKFHESEDAMGGMLTSVGVVLPAKIYEGAVAARGIKRLRRDDPIRMAWDIQQILAVEIDGQVGDIEYTKFEVELMERLGKFGLAR